MKTKILLTIGCAFIAHVLIAQPAGRVIPSQVNVTQQLKIRHANIKTSTLRLKPSNNTGMIIVKFAEGTHIRLRGVNVSFNSQVLTSKEKNILSRLNLNNNSVQQQLQQFTSLKTQNTFTIKRMFVKKTEEIYDSERVQLELKEKEELADLNLYYIVQPTDTSRQNIERLVNMFNSLSIVENAYPAYKPEDAVDIPPTTGDLSSGQGYLNPAPNGIDATYAWRIKGGKGADVKIIDVEGSWQTDHEDFPAIFWTGGFVTNLSSYHGTAVIGVMGAPHNGYGVNGICPDSKFGLSSVARIIPPGYFVGVAIDDAADQLSYGDIILIEQHALGPSSGDTADDCNPKQFEFVPMEFFDDCWDAIRRATAKGIIVVEAAGNGSMNLDNSIYNGKFDRTIRDSRAIMVGAGSSTRVPSCFTNFGSRIDVNGWGRSVTTTFGADSGLVCDIKVNGDDIRQFYTDRFSGTSSASPIVAGAAACIQGILKSYGRRLLNSRAMRNLLVSTGTPQSSDFSVSIGMRPNIKAALESIDLNFVPEKPQIFPSNDVEYPSPMSITIVEGNVNNSYNKKTWATIDGTIPVENASNSTLIRVDLESPRFSSDPLPLNTVSGPVKVTAKTFSTSHNIRIDGDTATLTYQLYQPGAGPANVRASNNFEDKVVLTWDRLQNASSYDIFYQYSEQNPLGFNGYQGYPVKVNTSPITGTTFEDYANNGLARTVGYYVRATLNNDRITKATYVEGATVPPSLVLRAEQISTPKSVKVSWEYPSWGGMMNMDIKYNIFKGTSQDFNQATLLHTNSSYSEVVASIRGNPVRRPYGAKLHYEDTNVIAGQTYYYWVRAEETKDGITRISPIGNYITLTVQ